MFDDVVVDKSIDVSLRGRSAVRRQSRQRSSVGKRSILLVVQSVDEVLEINRMADYILFQVS